MPTGRHGELSTGVRYLLATVVTAGFMIWQSTDSSTDRDARIDQALFWSIAVAIGWLQMLLIARGVRVSLGAARHPGWVLLLTSALIGALPLTFEVRWLMETVVAPERGLPPPWITYLNVSFINLNFSLIQYLFVERWPLLGTADGIEASPPARTLGPALEPEADERAGALGSPTHGDGSETVAATGTPSDAREAAAVAMEGAPLTRESGDDATEADVSVNAPSNASPIPATVARLRHPPDGLDGHILYLRADDHYLHVHTDRGKGLALCRIGDAEADLAATDGLRVHRSWWVSRAAVRRVERRKRARHLIMADGTSIPIGRSYESALRERGWL